MEKCYRVTVEQHEFFDVYIMAESPEAALAQVEEDGDFDYSDRDNLECDEQFVVSICAEPGTEENSGCCWYDAEVYSHAPRIGLLPSEPSV